MIRLLACLFLLPAAVAAAPVDLSSAPAYPELHAPVEPSAASHSRDMVLLGADLVEIAVALGVADRILARPVVADLPGIEAVPHVLRERAGVEGMVALRPAVVVASSVVYATLFDGLAALDMRTEMIDRSLPATEKVRRFARLAGVEERGEALVAAIETDYARAIPPEGDRPIRILHISKQGAGGNFSAGGAATAVDNLIRRVGALNAAAEVGRDRYRSVTPEGVLMMAPDVVLISGQEIEAFGGMEALWTAYPGLALTPAGQNRRLVVMREAHVRNDAASSGIATLALSQALAEMFP